MFCIYCGAQMPVDQRICSACRNPVSRGSQSPYAMGRVAGNIRMLAMFWIALSAIHLLRGGGRLLGARLVRMVSYDWYGEVPWGWPIGNFLHSVLWFVGGLSILMAIAGFIAGFGLLERRPWARTFAIILAVISLLNPLLGTLLGAYTLWVLLPDHAEDEYRRIARPV